MDVLAPEPLFDKAQGSGVGEGVAEAAGVLQFQRGGAAEAVGDGVENRPSRVLKCGAALQ